MRGHGGSVTGTSGAARIAHRHIRGVDGAVEITGDYLPASVLLERTTGLFCHPHLPDTRRTGFRREHQRNGGIVPMMPSRREAHPIAAPQFLGFQSFELF